MISRHGGSYLSLLLLNTLVHIISHIYLYIERILVHAISVSGARSLKPVFNGGLVKYRSHFHLSCERPDLSFFKTTVNMQLHKLVFFSG